MTHPVHLWTGSTGLLLLFLGIAAHSFYLADRKKIKKCGQQGFEKLICKSSEAKNVPVILLRDKGYIKCHRNTGTSRFLFSACSSGVSKRT